jgi:hypothetical protein
MTSRRGFLGALLGAAVLDPEKLLWVPGAKTISIPRPALHLRAVYLEHFGGKREWTTIEELAARFGHHNFKIGDTLWIQRPTRWEPDGHGMRFHAEAATATIVGASLA